jgi:peptidoglycan/xylan/chitin deacetylase (PgdA/CDA1 family)
MTGAVFVLSLDTELVWGTRSMKLRSSYERERAVIADLLALLERYRVKATWAVVGHLFLDRCTADGGIKHPEIVRTMTGQGGDWFDLDPATDVSADPLWYGPDIVDRIRRCPVPQEIGCHTFSHVVADDDNCTAQRFDSELQACRALADAAGIDLQSFVFPRDGVAHLGVLKANRFACFRGKMTHWYIRQPSIVRRVAHVLDEYLVPGAPAVIPRIDQGLWNIPGSYVYPHARGWAKWLPVSFRARKAARGIQRAIDEQALFHLWFHPFDLASNPRLLDGIEAILRTVDRERSRGRLRNLTMGELAAELGAEAA